MLDYVSMINGNMGAFVFYFNNDSDRLYTFYDDCVYQIAAWLVSFLGPITVPDLALESFNAREASVPFDPG